MEDAPAKTEDFPVYWVDLAESYPETGTDNPTPSVWSVCPVKSDHTKVVLRNLVLLSLSSISSRLLQLYLIVKNKEVPGQFLS